MKSPYPQAQCRLSKFSILCPNQYQHQDEHDTIFETSYLLDLKITFHNSIDRSELYLQVYIHYWEKCSDLQCLVYWKVHFHIFPALGKLVINTPCRTIQNHQNHCKCIIPSCKTLKNLPRKSFPGNCHDSSFYKKVYSILKGRRYQTMGGYVLPQYLRRSKLKLVIY